MSATLTITIPPDLSRAISGLATARGKLPEEYALEVLQRDAELPSIRELLADVYQEIDESGISSEDLDAKIASAVTEVRGKRRA